MANLMIFGQGMLTGNMVDKKDNTPLVGAIVYFSEIEKGVVTDAIGNYTISSLPRGEQLLTISYMGYTTKIIKINIGTNMQVLNVALIPEVIQGEEVVISGNFTGRQHVNTVKINTLEKKSPTSIWPGNQTTYG